MGETDDNLLNYSDDKQFEIRHKLNLKYKLKQHTFNLNNQFTYSRYRPKDDYTAEYVGFDPSGFPSNMKGNTLGLAHEYSSRNNKLQNSLMFSLYYLNSGIYRTSDKIVLYWVEVDWSLMNKLLMETLYGNFRFCFSK